MKGWGERFWYCIAFLGIFLLLQQFCLQTTKTTVCSPRLPEAFNGFRVVQLSDLHGRQFGQNNALLLRRVAALKPDMIAVTGDFLDEDRELARSLSLLSQLQALAPTFFVTGNHEWSLSHVQDVLDRIRDTGVTVLENEGVLLSRDGQQLLLGGVHDPCGFRDQPNPLTVGQTLRKVVGDETFFLLLAHRNETAPYWAGTQADLILTGHAHGGLIRLPLLGGMVPRHGQVGYDSGLYAYGESKLYVSRGLGGRGLRLFNRPEVSLIVLRKS